MFASDVPRGLISMVPAVILTFAGQFVLILVMEIDLLQLTAASVLLFWAVYCVSAIVVTLTVFGRVDADELSRRMRATAPPTGRLRHILWASMGGGAVSWAITGSSFAILAVIYMALNPRVAASPAVTWCAVAAVAGSWAVTMLSYAVRIARENVLRGGAEFPGDEAPRFSDYLYLAAQLGTTFGGSDVSFTKRSMRRIVTGDSIISFTFNTVIVALLVSVLIARVS